MQKINGRTITLKLSLSVLCVLLVSEVNLSRVAPNIHFKGGQNERGGVKLVIYDFQGYEGIRGRMQV